MTESTASFAERSDPQAVAILAAAIDLEVGTGEDASSLPLRGKKIGLMCEAGSANALLIREAAEALGAHVAAIGPMWRTLSTDSRTLSTNETLSRIAEAIGRLYDAVECEGMPPALLHPFESHCGIPIFEGLGSALHPTAYLAEFLDKRIPAVDRRRMIVQGALLVALR